MQIYYLKAKVGYKYVKGDIEWNEWATIKYPCICFFAGFFAGMFGVGGGIVKGPLMLEMGVDPQVGLRASADWASASGLSKQARGGRGEGLMGDDVADSRLSVAEVNLMFCPFGS